MKITNIHLALCALPLERPIRLGSVTVSTRDYVVMRVMTDDGVEGYGIGYRSGTALLDAAAAIAPQLIGRDPIMRREILQSCENGMIQGRGTIVRTLSLIDLALWDITAKVARQPLYRLLGGFRTSVPALPVAGFSYETRDRKEIEDELERHVDSGIRQIKIMIKGNDARGNAAYVEQMAKKVEGRAELVLDTHWSWRHLSEALDTCRRIDDLGLGFIEDPFLPQQWRLAAEMRTKLKTPIAIWEDVLDQYGFLDLVQNVDVLRVDATASVGITAAMAAMTLASAFGRQCVPHAFPYIHLQLACAHPVVSAVEYIPAETGADPIRLLLADYPKLDNGRFIVSEEPGNGLLVDWEAVGRHRTAGRSVDS